jgi:hypothetical protein
MHPIDETRKELDLAAIYNAAADWLEAHEWCQGALGRDADGHLITPKHFNDTVPASCCGEGAIRLIVGNGGGPVYFEALRRLDNLVDRTFFQWNDAPGRTKAEVIAKLREASALAAAGAPS